MNNETLLSILKNPQFKFNPARCRNENIALQAAKFLRWVCLNAPCTNAQVINAFGTGLAYIPLRAGYVTNPLGQHGDEKTNLWMLTSAGLDLLKRLVE